MPKSNFNQFLDECEEFRTVENTSISKISFEPKSACNDECENQTNSANLNNENGRNHNHDSHNHVNHVNNLNTFSSNIFLSKSANNTRDRFDRFSTNRVNNYTNVTASTDATNVKSNLFKKMDNNNNCLNPIPTVSSTSTSVIEINNETFPSLTGATTASSVPKKIKNYKDAICAAAPTSTEQKQTRVLPISAFPPPLVVKRDSEMYAKKMLAKTKTLAAFYDDNEDDDDDDENNNDDDIRDFRCSRNSKPTFINSYGNDSD